MKYFNVKWSRLKSEGIPKINDIVEWMDYIFIIEEVSNLREDAVDFTAKGGSRTELYKADLKVKTANDISDTWLSHLESGCVHVRPLQKAGLTAC